MIKIHEPIVKLIESFSYDSYIIQPVRDVYCTCLNETTMQGDPTCKKCLGTGRKIKIRKLRAASEETKFIPTVRNESGFQVSKIYYTSKDYKYEDNNIIIDEGKAYNVFRIKKNTGLKHEFVYYSLFSYLKKNDNKILLKNFNEILKEASSK